MRSRDYFLGKRIAVIGLGAHGEMMVDIKFLAKANALVSVYDLRGEAKLSPYLSSLRSFGLANQVLGSIPADDLEDMDLIILSHEYPRTSSFLKSAREKDIAIEYPETLFLKLAPPVSVVGVMGACGKSTVVSMLAPLIETAVTKKGSQSFFTIDPESEEGILAHLGKIKNGDIVIARIVPKMMPEIVALKWSPHIAIFTTIPPKGAFVNSAFEILEHQTYNNYVIGDDQIIDAIRSSGMQSRAKLLRTKATIVPEKWVRSANPHDREDASLALEAARIFKVGDETAEAIFAMWKPLKGHIEPVKKVKSVEFFNDTAAVNPIATIAGMSVLATNKNLVLIMGGADHGDDMGALFAAVGEYAHTVIAVPGSGTLRERQSLLKIDKSAVLSASTLEEAVHLAVDHAHKGDKVLFSPAFPPGGVDSSTIERGERFVRTVRAL